MSEANLSSFVAGFAGRRDAAGAALRQAYAAKGVAFAPRDITPTPPGEPAQPRHFSPAETDTNPTEGWDPLDAAQPATGFIDPVQTARQQGYDEGLAAALANGGVWASATRRCSKASSRPSPTTVASIVNGSPGISARR
ncbi:hypothetical protein [Sphingomonas panacisoli]|uniref:hypothetical protein n=1 Tax=Sphingomonas panacisoli TaxID=1813879 RepID=UPI001F01456C|nr:hypothetical protein [Sphingomonas panacisoli]